MHVRADIAEGAPWGQGGKRNEREKDRKARMLARSTCNSVASAMREGEQRQSLGAEGKGEEEEKKK